ncbi:thiaminase II [Staphylothermus hellenicus]|uniref:Transcriptional activator, TenA family n=1 Tax=Staphylothermus hellenicus (strain DSM 12710 / JCM 10830 / BK20S6-10-b1 / P8) TaxID=591019 RepID=D7D7Y2_STAHD|nr:thiaminase II [Staphylothermus hellenicus]ADI31878.1 transcriptional activator, TenA family [Staphylothermus hellenicus DSM 12710]
MPVTQRLREEANSIWDKIFKHPFVVELFKGSLPMEKFRYYVIQDYNFLIGMTKAFSLLASKAYDYELLREALMLAYGDATIEMDNYLRLLDRIGLTIEEVLNTEPAPTNIAYVNHVLSTCSLGTPIECLVSTLPCFWTYMEIPRVNKDLIMKNKNPVYLDWINTYRSKEYIELTTKLINLVDKYAKHIDYNKLKRIFILSSRYEYMFWDMAYNIEKWPI